MIDDETIDLTVDSKFTRIFSNGVQRWTHFYNEQRAVSKLFPGKPFNISLAQSWMLKFKLPWNHKPVPNNERINYWKKDPLSFQMRSTIRTTSDNNWFLSNQLTPEVIDDYFVEETGAIPFQSIKYCLRCTNKKITTIKNRLRIGYCEKCNSTIPWQNKPISTLTLN